MYKQEHDKYVITGMVLDYALGFENRFDDETRRHVSDNPGDLYVAIEAAKLELMPVDSEQIRYRFRVLGATLRKVIKEDAEGGIYPGTSDPGVPLSFEPRLIIPGKKAA